MKVCIVRNTEARTNAAISRVVSALEDEVDDICLLTRNRYVKNFSKNKNLNYQVSNKTFENYEISLKAETGKGLFNLLQLVIYMSKVFKWFVKNKKRYDVIHAFDLDTGLPAVFACALFKKRYVYHIADFYADSRDYMPKMIKTIVRKLEHFIINSAETTIICTEERIEQIEGSRPKKLVVVHNTPSISIDSIRTDFIKEKDPAVQFKIAYVGSLTENRFIRILTDVIKKYPQVVINLAGMGPLAEYVEKLADIHNNISYFGIIDYDEALKLYSESNIMIAVYDPKVANHKFSAPNKVYEAMMLGKMIIVAKGTGIDQIVTSNKMGVAIEYSEYAFEQAVLNIINNPDIITQFGLNSQNAYKNYSWDIMKDRLASIYRSICL